ncbi:MAG: isoprenylcysteine carboxylmethyltransferase family protein [Clostridia bacterium]|nr:isoprenylcysteine carboxylmethyltransferase family protein [Clostridia bacterium]
MKLAVQAIVKFLAGLLLVGVLLFVPAGTLHYAGGWLFMGLLFIPIFLLGLFLLLRAPALLKKRLDGKESDQAQRGVVVCSALLFMAGFIVAGLDFRFGWSRVPTAVTVAAAVLFVAAYGLYAEVMRENTYLSRTIRVQEGQTVIDSGLYGIVRHPMYAATVLLFLMIPLVLGSWWAVIPFAGYPALIARRILGEEALLAEQLDGYTAYTQKVKYRLLPFIW